MTRRYFEHEQERIRRTLKDVSFALDVFEKEITDLRKQRQSLLDQLLALDECEQISRHRAMKELIRMCNTPVWRYRPRTG